MKNFCPKDGYKLRMIVSNKVGDDTNIWKCIPCGYHEPMDPKTDAESLILKTVFNSGSSASGASSGVDFNELTLFDPTLPHMKTLRCFNESCDTRKDISKQDVIYIKTDPINLKFKYMCTVCETKWTS
jgi:hypothetical protein